MGGARKILKNHRKSYSPRGSLENRAKKSLPGELFTRRDRKEALAAAVAIVQRFASPCFFGNRARVEWFWDEVWALAQSGSLHNRRRAASGPLDIFCIGRKANPRG